MDVLIKITWRATDYTLDICKRSLSCALQRRPNLEQTSHQWQGAQPEIEDNGRYGFVANHKTLCGY